MAREKISYLDEMVVSKEDHYKDADMDICIQMLVYEEAPTNCAIQINGRVYDEYTSFDKCFKTYSVITKVFEIISGNI